MTVYQEKQIMRIEPLFVLQNGEVPAHPYSKQLEEDVIEDVSIGVQNDYQVLIQQKIADLECPQHHRHARVRVTAVSYSEGNEFFDGDYHLETCCPEFKTAVLESLKLQ
jgi:hypothetical protein